MADRDSVKDESTPIIARGLISLVDEVEARGNVIEIDPTDVLNTRSVGKVREIAQAALGNPGSSAIEGKILNSKGLPLPTYAVSRGIKIEQGEEPKSPAQILNPDHKSLSRYLAELVVKREKDKKRA